MAIVALVVVFLAIVWAVALLFDRAEKRHDSVNLERIIP
jgi:hypothetical protein